MAKTVLIVEDNELNMKLFHDLLEAHGYQTVGTRNVIESLDLARKHRPDLIIMDIQLPEVSGLEAGSIRNAAQDPQFLAGILDHVAGDEALLVAFAAHAGIPPERVVMARDMLSGGRWERDIP